jgi:hypothetical protein
MRAQKEPVVRRCGFSRRMQRFGAVFGAGLGEAGVGFDWTVRESGVVRPR